MRLQVNENSNGEYVNQGLFKRNINNCWFASAMNAHNYNITHRPNTLHFQHRVEEEAYKRFAMPTGGLTAKGGVQRICDLLGARKAQCKRGDKYFHNRLDKGYALVVTITTYQSLVDQRFNNEVIRGASGRARGGHVLCVFKKNGKYYFLNSRGGDPIREIKDINDKFFRTWEGVWLITKSAKGLSPEYLDYINQYG